MAIELTNRTFIPVMGSQSNQCNVTVNNMEFGDDESFDDVPADFRWTSKNELSILKNLVYLKPAGINKHLNMLMISEAVSKELKLNISTKRLWKYIGRKWNVSLIDQIEGTSFSNREKDFNLSEDYDSLVAKMNEKIKKDLEKNDLNDENNKKKFSGVSRTRSKSNSMSSVDSKDGPSEVTSTLTDGFSVKTSEVGSDEVLSSRRSLRANDKLEDKEFVDSLDRKKLVFVHSSSEDHNKSKDLNQLNKKMPGKTKDLDKNKQLSNVRGLKRKSRNVSESSVNSDVGKQPRFSRSNAIDLGVSDSSSRSITPEIFRSTSSNRSVTPEVINRKSNLRSSDKDQKNKSLTVTDKASTKYNLIEPVIKINRFKLDKSEKQVTKSIPKQLTPGKDETSKTKNKIRGRVSSDYLVVHQPTEIQLLGRRSLTKS